MLRLRSPSSVALVLIGCGVERIGDGGDSACVPPAVQQVFDARCNSGTSCHASGSANGSFAAGESAAIIGGPSKQSTLPLVVLGSIEGSYLAHKIMAVPPMPIMMTRMPMGASFDDPALAEDLALVLGWIGGATLPGCAGGESSTSGGDELLACGLADLDPGAANPVVAGDGAMQIPTEIGAIFTANCGCHLNTSITLARGVAPYPPTLPFKMATWADWHSDYAAGVSMLEQARPRLDPSALSLMPQKGVCNVGNGETMPADERSRLLEWIDAGGPDGASWP